MVFCKTSDSLCFPLKSHVLQLKSPHSAGDGRRKHHLFLWSLPKKLLCSAEIHKNHQELHLKFHVNSTKTIPSNSRFRWNSAKFSKKSMDFQVKSSKNHQKPVLFQVKSIQHPVFFCWIPPPPWRGRLGWRRWRQQGWGWRRGIEAEPLCKSWPTLSTMEVTEDFLKKFPRDSHGLIIYIFVNYKYFTNPNSKAIWGWFPLLTMIPVRSQWGRYNLHRYIDISGWWFELTPLKNDGSSSVGWWNSQYMEK